MLFIVPELEIGNLTYANSVMLAVIIKSDSCSEYVLFCI